jgi:predicted nuclease of predicted toxin-antitoxin system
MIRLYSNENFPIPVVEELQKMGYDVLTIQETGKANQEFPDELVLQEASAVGRVILTINRQDFKRLHKRNPNHEGIIICTMDLDFEGQARRIHAAIEVNQPLEKKLVRVNRPDK